MEKQNVLVSACLTGENCKYNGRNNLNKDILDWAEATGVNLISVCPEQMGGLSTPRVPAERCGTAVLTQDGHDVTRNYLAGAEKALEIAKANHCRYAIFKAKSPSCGCRNIYDGNFSKKVISGQGIAAELLCKNDIKVFNENELSLLKVVLGDCNSQSGTNTICDVGSIPFLRFPNLINTPSIVHASSTRLGGVSGKTEETAHFASMNLSFNSGDVPDDVRENYRIFCNATGIPFDNITFSAQTHTSNIRVINSEDIGKGLNKKRDYADIDGLITNTPGAALTIFSADCVPILFADKNGRAIGAAHCGWRGTFSNLQSKMVNQFRSLYNIEATDLTIAIGPCIHAECYEVDENLYTQFTEMLTAALIKDRDIASVAICRDGKYFLDLPNINKLLLKKAGVPSDNIFVSDLCTSCHSDFLFSHRASNGKRGLLASMIMINK